MKSPATFRSSIRRAARARTALGLVVLLAAALAGCSTDEPSTPTQPPANPTPPAPPSGFSVTVSVSPSSLDAGSSSPATVTVRVSANSGAALPAGSQVVLTTTLGGFGSTGGPNTTTLDLINGQAQAFLFGNGAAGIAQLRATFTPPNGSAAVGSSSVEFRPAATFFISSVSPGSGSAQGGDTVTILGGGFDPPFRVTFNGTPATVVSSSSTQLRVRTPQQTVAPGTSLPVDVSVTVNLNETGQAVDVLPRGFTYVNGGGTGQPVLLSMNPVAGPNDGGTPFTLIGAGFESPVQVLFGSGTPAAFAGVEATVTSVTGTTIQGVTPQAFGFGIDNRDQLVTVLVRNINSGAGAVLGSAFQYGARIAITAMGPGAGPRIGGTRVTIFGQGFDDPVAVSLGGVGQTVVSTAGTEIQFVTSGTNAPCGATDPVASPVSVTNIDTGATATANIGFTYLFARPTIFGVSPNSGPGGGGNSVTITGTGFEAPVRVLIDEKAASVTASSATSVTATVPAFTGDFESRACTIGGGPGTQLVPTSVDVQVINLNTGCGDTDDRVFEGGYTYLPADQTCRPTGTPPTASFTFSVGGPPPGHTVLFTDTSSGSPTTWLWSFGDATTSGAQNPTHVYVLAGTYTVTLTVTNAIGSSSTSQFVTVPAPP